MNLLIAAVNRHPAVVVVVVLVAVSLLLFAAADAFVGAAERDDSRPEGSPR